MGHGDRNGCRCDMTPLCLNGLGPSFLLIDDNLPCPRKGKLDGIATAVQYDNDFVPLVVIGGTV